MVPCISNQLKHIVTKVLLPVFKIFLITQVMNSCVRIGETEVQRKALFVTSMMAKCGNIFSNGVPFLAQPYDYLLMLNCDWFQPYKHTQFSIGVLYATVANLPRTVRFKRDNVIILGVLPGPSGPSMTINSYLQPIVIYWLCGKGL